MPVYDYKGLTPTGDAKAGIVDADSPRGPVELVEPPSGYVEGRLLLPDGVTADNLQVVVQTAMEKDRDRRYQTALDLAEDLRRVREHRPTRAQPPPGARDSDPCPAASPAPRPAGP